jgi:hypothetical protein
MLGYSMLLYPNAPSVNTLNKAKKKVFKLEFDRFNNESPFGETKVDSKTLEELVPELQKVVDNMAALIVQLNITGNASTTQILPFQSILSRAFTLLKKINFTGLPLEDVDTLQGLSDMMNSQRDAFNDAVENVSPDVEQILNLITKSFSDVRKLLESKLLQHQTSGVKAPLTMEGSGFQLSELRPFSGVECEYPRRYL